MSPPSPSASRDTEQERNRRAWAGRTSNHPLSYPQTTQHKTTVWGFDTSGLVDAGGRGGGIPGSPAPAPAASAASAALGNPKTPRNGLWRGGRKGRRLQQGEPVVATVPLTEIEKLGRLRAGVGGGLQNAPLGPGGAGDGTGVGAGGDSDVDGEVGGGGVAGEGAVEGGTASLSDGSRTDAAGGEEAGSLGEAEGVEGVGGWLGWEAGSGSGSGSEEGRWGRPMDSRGSSSVRRESKTSFHDGVLEVVAVEGVLHLGQIQVRFGLGRAVMEWGSVGCEVLGLGRLGSGRGFVL